MGLQWRELAKQFIVRSNNDRLEKEQKNTYLQNLQELSHNCKVKNPKDLELGASWLMMMLNTNGIDMKQLLDVIVAIIDMKTSKVNTLVFRGPTNTGKTLMAKLINSHLTIGTVCRRGDQTAFHFDNLLNRTVALMEEPHITMTTKNDFKNLLGGDEFEIDVKYGAKRFLGRLPIIATTIEDLGALLTSVDRAALYSRVKEYQLREQIMSELINGTISKAPVTLCACHLRDLFKRYGFYGDRVLEIDVPPNAEIIYQTPRRTSTEEYDIEEDGFLIRIPPKIKLLEHERPNSPSFLGLDPFDIEDCQEIFPSAQRLGNMGEGQQSLIPPGLVTEDSLPNDNVSMGGVPFTPRRYYYTLILHNYGKMPTAISCPYVEHDHHMHVLIQARDNVYRKVDRLLNDCLVSANDWWLVKNTWQLVRNVYLILQYFKFRETVHEVSTELHEEWEMAQNSPPIEPQIACLSDIRRTRNAINATQRAESRHGKYNNLLE
ncbi:unnamed protein product [Rodentolepis nana]|uniref:Parvo_NS1 domain-containing protein n=1 Tax=Rodentolepis nana TaxID=102285 RepID=A0A0R3TQ85_RODNA|nr:unnamed protein product [Rodentolepis nana]